jgi:hypothetical protein
MMLRELLANGYEGNTWVVNKEVDGLTHADSLIQPPYHGNCLNWVVGHIVQARCRVLDLLGESSIWDDAQRERYVRGSDPVTGEGAYVLPFETLLADLDRAGTLIAEAIHRLEDADLEVIPEGSEQPLGQRLLGQYWHETYHVGQTDLLRQITGKNDKVF